MRKERLTAIGDDCMKASSPPIHLWGRGSEKRPGAYYKNFPER